MYLYLENQLSINNLNMVCKYANSLQHIKQLL